MTTQPYHILIGLEVHVQLSTRTKLFCGCRTDFGLPPNSATCPVCMGLPGALPVLNRRAFELSLRAALALNCGIAPFTKWDRKNYFYPDLPKNYQISQYDLPLGGEGWLEVPFPAGTRRVGIIRAHLEEDAGKLVHEGDASLVDLNRTGTPLLEIVGQPELHSPEEARLYLEEMALLMREIGVSDCRMEEGSLRCDANVNLHLDGGAVTPIVEIKNVNSFRFLERAIRHEAQRQYETWLRDPNYVIGKVSKETAGWDEEKGVTVFQRRKEEAADYRYFPDPDLVPVKVDAAMLDRARADLGELPAQARERLPRQYGLTPYDAGVLLGLGRAGVDYFEEAARVSGEAKAACNWITNQVAATLKETKGTFAAFPIPAGRLGGLIGVQKQMGLNKQQAGEVYARMLSSGETAEEAVKALGIQVVSDTSAVAEIVRRAMAANPKAVADYRAGKKAAANSLKGAVMKETRGSVRPDVVDRVLTEELERGG